MRQTLLYFSLLIMLLGCAPAYAQYRGVPKVPELIPFRSGEFWGYANPEGKLVIPAIYFKVEDFEGDYAKVSKWMEHGDDQWGLINKKGEEVLPVKFENFWRLPSGLFVVQFSEYDSTFVPLVKESGNIGIIDINGKIILPPKYNGIVPLTDYILSARTLKERNDVYTLITQEGKEMPGRTYDKIDEFRDGFALVRMENIYNNKYHTTFGYIDTMGREVIPPLYPRIRTIHDGCAWYFSEAIKKYGLVDIYGHKLLEPIYDSVLDFSDGMARVMLYDKVNPKVKHFGFVDTHGKNITGMGFTSVHAFHDGLAWIRVNGKVGFIDKTGKIVIPCIYDAADDFDKGVSVMKLGKLYGILDTKGKVPVPAQYDYVGFSSNYEGHEDFIFISHNHKYGFYNSALKALCAPVYDEPFEAYHFHMGLIAVSSGKKFGFVDMAGKLVIPIKYDHVSDFDGPGWAIIYENMKCGIISREGRIVVPIVYDELNLCQRGFPIITVEGSDSGRMIYGILHEDGSKMPVSFEFSRIGEYSEGYWQVRMDKKIGYMDSLGKLVIPFTYDIAYSFYNGVAIVAMVDYRLYPDIGLMGLIDKKGKAITPLKYSEISGSLETGLYTVHVKKKVGTISNTGIEYFKN